MKSKYSCKNLVNFITENSLNYGGKTLKLDFTSSDFIEIDEEIIEGNENTTEMPDTMNQSEDIDYGDLKEGEIGGMGGINDPMGPNGGTIKSEINEYDQKDEF